MNMTHVKILALVTMMGAVSACGQMKLPDDPDSETQASLSDSTEEENEGANSGGESPIEDLPAPDVAESVKDQTLKKYAHLDPKRLVDDGLLEKAVLYFDANLTKTKNQNYLSVIDFSKKSTKSRFFIINMKTGEVLAIHTSHGKGSDANHDGYAESFSNASGSNQSSLGFYRTAETYSGKHGLSLRLDGLSSTNSRARSRAIVLHGAGYVKESSVIQGRSWGCPAVAMDLRDSVIAKIKGGSLIYAGLSGVK